MSPRTASFYLAILLSACAPAQAGHVDCIGEIDDDIDGELRIAAPCILRDLEVDGDVRLYAGGSLIAESVEFEGDIKGDSADFVELRNIEVDGDVSLKQMVGDLSVISDSSIDGKINLDRNRSTLQLFRSYVDRNVTISENIGGVVVSDNVIDGDLDCKKNAPAPEVSNNSVAGKEKDQCDSSSSNEKPGPPPGSDGTETGGDGDTTEINTAPPELNLGTGGGGAIGLAGITLFGSLLLLSYSRRRLAETRR